MAQSKPTKDNIVTAICRQTTIPKGANIVRLPGTGNARPSAIAPPFIKPVLNWSTPPPLVNQMLPADEAVVIVTNDPLHAVIFTDKNPLLQPLRQVWSFSDNPTDNGLVAITPGNSPPLDNDLYCSTPAATFKAWHGPRLYALRWKGKYYMWCDAPTAALAGNNIVISTSGVAMAAGDAVNISLYRLNDGDEQLVQSTRVAGPFAINTPIQTILLPAPDWYRVAFYGDDDNTTAQFFLSIVNNAVCEMLVHLALPDLSERMLALVQSIRVIGASAHIMNLVSDQNATGSWVGDQPEGSILYTSFIRGVSGANGFQRLTTARGNEVMELKKYNPYGWVSPESEKSWSYRQPFTFNSAGQVTNIINDDMSTFDYIIFYLKSGGTAIAADLSRNCQLEFFFATEYLSEGLWMMPGVSPATQDDQDAARKVLCSMENIGHNPAFGEIMKTIGKYVRLSAPVLALLGPYGKAASVAAAGVGEGLGMAFGYRTKKTARPEEDSPGDETRAGRFQKVEELGS